MSSANHMLVNDQKGKCVKTSNDLLCASTDWDLQFGKRKYILVLRIWLVCFKNVLYQNIGKSINFSTRLVKEK
jgi:hypothetical protein